MSVDHTLRPRPDHPASGSCYTAVAALLVVAWSPAQDVAAEVASARAAGVRTAVCVVDVDRDQTLFTSRADAAQLPASNQKILTAWAFLDALGPEYRFRTGFRLERGRLVVEAGGDPNWITGGPVDPAQTIASLAEALRAAGISAIRGIDLEAGRFSGPIRPEGWAADQLTLYYSAPTGGLVLERGCWVAEIAPGGDHDALVRVVGPPGALRQSGRITMTEDRVRGGRYSLVQKGDALHLSGQFWRRGQIKQVRGAVVDPAALFARCLTRQLARGGVVVDAEAGAKTVELPSVHSELAPALTRVLKHSSNFDAEQLLRVLGAETRDDGSFAGGLAALRARLEERLGEVPDSIRLADGSGLSRGDRLTARLVADVLVEAARFPHAKVFVAALPVAGREGTLERRFRGSGLEGRVRAKTGTLSGVSALSGYLQTRSGRLLAFSILMEWSGSVQGGTPKQRQERIVAAIDRGLG